MLVRLRCFLLITSVVVTCEVQKTGQQRELSLWRLGDAEETGRGPKDGWTNGCLKAILNSLKQCGLFRTNPTQVCQRASIFEADTKSSSKHGFSEAQSIVVFR